MLGYFIQKSTNTHTQFVIIFDNKILFSLTLPLKNLFELTRKYKQITHEVIFFILFVNFDFILFLLLERVIERFFSSSLFR